VYGCKYNLVGLNTMQDVSTVSEYLDVITALCIWLSAYHGGRAVWGMNCLFSLEQWDRGFESHSRHGCFCMRIFCVYVVLCVGSDLATSWSLVKESYCLCKKDYESEVEARTQQRAAEPLMNEWMNEWMDMIMTQDWYALYRNVWM
jgi:hypothetical protein